MLMASIATWLETTPARALSGGSPVAHGMWNFVAKVNVGSRRACSGALVSPQWVITSASCFALDGAAVTTGAPGAATSVTVGQADPAGSGRRVVPAVKIVPHPARDVVLVKLALRLTDITPVTVTRTAPAAGQALQVAGYGRTTEEWVPDRLYAAPVVAQTVAGGSFGWTGADGVAVSACQGDSGGPVLRTGSGSPELVGLNIAGGQGGCLDAAGDRPRGADAVRVDDLADWVLQNALEPTAAFRASFNAATGIGGYDLKDSRDQVLAFDYEGTGKLDHLLLYRPGVGTVWILKHGADDAYTPVYSSTSGGIGGYDLKNAADRIIAFDYAGTGKLDHLLLYRPGAERVSILKHGTGSTFTPVFSSTSGGIGGYDLKSPADRIIAFDHEGTGKLDHLLLYRPGVGTVWILKHDTGDTFTRAYSSTSGGIGGHTLESAKDQIIAFDRDHSGGYAHLLLYRPGDGIVWGVGREEPAGGPPVTFQPALGADSIVETFAYPGAAEILESINIRLISGDGHILLADCATAPVDDIGVIKVYTTEQIGPGGSGRVCFKVTGPSGRLDLQVPGVFEIRGDGQRPGHGHRLTAVVKPESGQQITVVVNPSGSTQVGVGADPDAEPTTLLQLRVPS